MRLGSVVHVLASEAKQSRVGDIAPNVALPWVTSIRS